MPSPLQAEAGAAFKLLHGAWFSGHIVSVKYMRPERYWERFPGTERANITLRPSSASAAAPQLWSK